MNVGQAHRQIQRMHREVTQGAYLAYPFEDMGMFGHSSGQSTEPSGSDRHLESAVRQSLWEGKK